MTEIELLDRWAKERPMYEAWGNLVTDTVLDGLEAMALPMDKFIKVPATPRSKAPDSLGDKAFRKGKNYKNPYEDITDKVGVRFVVLNTTAVDVVCEAIERIPNWDVEKDRDFEEERLQRPEVFGYQSSHFIASPAQPLEFNGFQIPMDTTCEIQVRSLTQHAWAETMHDTVYKPQTLEASPDVKRKCAQAVALTELLDQIYCDVEQAMNAASMNLDKQITTLAELYKDTVGQDPLDSTLNTYLLDAYTGLPEVDQREIVNFLHEYGYLGQTIRERAEDNVLYRQSAILFVYYQASLSRNKTSTLWPFTQDALDPVYTDLGIALS